MDAKNWTREVPNSPENITVLKVSKAVSQFQKCTNLKNTELKISEIWRGGLERQFRAPFL